MHLLGGCLPSHLLANTPLLLLLTAALLLLLLYGSNRLASVIRHYD